MAIENTTTVKAVTSGTQLSSVGTVKTVVGLVKAVDANGAERVLQVGDKVFANETIVTSADGGVIIEFQNGSHLDLPRSAHIMLDPEIYSAHASTSIEKEASDEAARIAKAIAEGRDPNAVANPAAAGGEAGDEGTSTPLVIDFDNTLGNVNSGYPTGPISLAFPPMHEELPPVPETAPIIQTPPTIDVTPPVYTPPEQTPPPHTAIDGIVSPGQVFEEGLDQAGTDKDGTSKDTDAETALGGTIVIADAEGLADIASITIGGVQFTIGAGGLAALVGEEIPGNYGFLKITAYDGNGTFTYSYTLTTNTNDNAGDETDSFTVVVTDAAGLSANASIVITIIDDVPLLNVTAAPTLGALSVVEASGAGEGKEATATITAPEFTYLAGADGLQSLTTTYALTLAGGTATGLVTTDGNYPITLSVSPDGQTISGLYNGSNVAFTVTLSGNTVTLVSNVALEHDNNQGPVPAEDNTLDISSLIKVTATITVTDNDGDVVSTNISTTNPLSIEFVDTNPSITNVVAPTLGALSVVEASGAGEGKEATATITPPTYTASGVDGTDGGVVTYALTLAGGTATGLVTTDGNYPITLSVSPDGQTISGLYNGSNVAFTVTLSGNTVTLVSNVALEHDNNQGPVPAEDNTLDISSLIKVTATITVTDNDGDVVSTNISTTNPLSIEFVDTNPSITNVVAPTLGALSVVEASGAGEGKEATATITPPTYTASGVDGTDGGVVTYALTLAGGTATGLVTTDGNYPITLSVSPDGQTISGLYNGSNVAFTVTLSGNTVTLVSNVALEHDNNQGPVPAEDNTLDISSLIKVTATITVTDNDGDVVSTNISTTNPLSIEFVDTNPSITNVVAPTLGALSVVEASGAGEGKEATATITPPTYTASGVDGTDGGVVTYALTLAGGTATGLVTTDGNYPITLSVSPDGQTISGLYNGSNVAFTVTLSGNTVTLVSNVALEHDNNQGPVPAEDNTLDISSLIKVTATITVTDNDGDVVSTNISTTNPLSIEFVDTNPSITNVVAPTLGALSVVEASGAGEGKEATATITPPTYTASGVDGTDGGVVTYALTLAGGTATGLVTTDGNYPITLSVSPDGQTISGLYNGSNVAFTVTLSGNTVTLVSNVALEHDNNQGPVPAEDNTLDISSLIKVTATITVTDNDGDVVSTNISTTNPLSIEFVDTNPSITNVVAPTLGALSVVEASGAGEGKEVTATITPPTYTASGVDGTDGGVVTYALTLAGGTATGLVTTDGNYPITLSVSPDGQTISGLYNGSNVAFTVTLSGNTVTLVSNVALEHDNNQGPVPAEDNTLDISSLIKVTATITVTDNDGDVVSTNISTTNPLSIEFVDTNPSITNVVAPTLGALSVVEASGAGEGKEATATITPPTYTASGVDGTDGGVVTYALTLAGGTATGLVTTDGNYPITLSVSPDGQTISGLYNGSNVAFTVTLSGNTVTLVSNVALEHDNNQGPVPAEDNTLDISSLIKVTATITVTDNDGDVVSTNISTTNPLSIEFVDTNPVSLTPTAIHMIDLATAPAITENLHFVSGADGVQTVRFTITDGVAAIDESTGNHLAYNGQQLYLHYGQTNGVIDYTILVATTSSALAPNGVLTSGSNVAYWIDINPDPLSGAGGSYTMHSNGVISNGTETTATNLNSVGGGNVTLKAISNIGGTTEDVVLTTKSGLTVNTNSSAIGIGNGQSFNGTDGIRFDFTNGTVSGNGGNAVYTADGTHNLTTSFKQEISLTAGASHADITIKAILADSDNVYYGDASGETPVSITAVRVYSGTLAQVQAGTATEIHDGQSVNGITLDYTINANGTINIVGLQSGWVFVVETTDSFSALQIDSLNTTGNYKLGVFAYGESSAGDPVDLSYNIVGVDGDGDTVSGTLAATLYPASATQSGINDGTPNDTLIGTINTDYLLGNLGDDVLSGLGGNDVLVGGAGTDTLTGGDGVDRFVMTNGDGPDIITDFTLGNLNPANGAVSANADILDISDVLAGAEITAAEFAASPGSFITFVQSGANTNVVLDLDGVAGGTTHVVATLQNTTATNFDINTLIGNGQIDYTS